MSDRIERRENEQTAIDLMGSLDRTFEELSRVLESYEPEPATEEIGIVRNVERGVVQIEGLPHIQSEEIIRLRGNVLGMALNLDADRLGTILLGESREITAGSRAYRTGRVFDVPVGEALLGRVVDATGRPLDGRGALGAHERLPIERDAPAIMDRDPVEEPLQTGIKVVDSLLPIGRGQRELILGDRQTGKTAIAVDTVINQQRFDVKCIYCVIGQRESSVASLVRDLRDHDAMDYTTVVAASSDAPPGLQYVAPYAATAVAEFFMERGEDALIIYDDLTRHARAYRELSLLLRRPPGREAYPGDIFYIHSRLLERSAHLNEAMGGGSLTALPIIETQEENISAYIPTNLISITDGQIFLSADLFQEGILPAVDVGQSVSRIGGKAQLAAYRSLSNRLRTAYSRYQELEAFARFGTRLEPETRLQIERGRRVQEGLQQSQHRPRTVPEQIVILMAVSSGLLDDVDREDVELVEEEILGRVPDEVPDIADKIQSDEELDDDDRERLYDLTKSAIGAALGEEEQETASVEREPVGDDDTEEQE